MKMVKLYHLVLDFRIGELLVGGSQLMDGYINKEYNFIEIENKRYYNTGDLVTIERGQIFWLSRNDSMIKKKGLRIYLNSELIKINYVDNMIQNCEIRCGKIIKNYI